MIFGNRKEKLPSDEIRLRTTGIEHVIIILINLFEGGVGRNLKALASKFGIYAIVNFVEPTG